MQFAPQKNQTLEELLKRQSEMQYSAMAHSLSGQSLPAGYELEYESLEQSIRREIITNRINEMQYEAMACAQAGQSMSEEFSTEFAKLELELKQINETS